jgi:hypothetical protein
VAALIAWMLVVRVGDLVKDGAKRRRLRRSSILDKIANANRVLSMRSRPLSGPSYIYPDSGMAAGAVKIDSIQVAPPQVQSPGR